MFSKILTGAVALSAVAMVAAVPAQAQKFPKKNITFLIAYGPGDMLDGLSRRAGLPCAAFGAARRCSAQG